VSLYTIDLPVSTSSSYISGSGIPDRIEYIIPSLNWQNRPTLAEGCQLGR